MWSHYATDRGFAIELYTDKLIKYLDKGIFDYLFFPINYVDCLQQFDPYNEKLGGRMGFVLYMISTKNREWEYENEWRLTCYLKDGNFNIPARFPLPKMLGHDHKLYYKDCIKQIILGRKFFHPDTSTYDSDGRVTVYACKDDNEQNKETYAFLNYIYDNYKSSLFMSDVGTHKKDHYITRVLYQIRLEKINDRAFSFCRVGEPFR